jgi:hypothetical protein
VSPAASPNGLPQFRWFNTLLGNFKASFSGTFVAFIFNEYTCPTMPAFCIRFNRCFSISAVTDRNAYAFCKIYIEWVLRSTEIYG